MSRRSKQKTLTRAQQQRTGRVIPMAELQAALAKLSRNPGDNGALFSPGKPLDPQQGADPQSIPRQWAFQPAYNTSGVDRTLQKQDIPSFQQLRTLAEMYEGIQLCEKVWLDLIPKMSIKLQLRPDLVAQGAEEKDFQKFMTPYLQFFEQPDGMNDLHSWLRMAITEQLQIDALYIYKQKDKAGRLLRLPIVAGDTMKPLLDDWGNIVGYQQWPWGIPGEIYDLSQMVYFRESPRTFTPYGKSRVERIMMRVNQALRKEKYDLARYTEGNIPAGIMEVPEASNWTPDQIDAYEQMWNALIAGNDQQRARIKFTQPGMKFTAFDQYEETGHRTEFDKFLLNITTAAFGVSMADLAFTEDIHKSADDGQQNMLYRRTLYPIVSMYGQLLTRILRDDFGEDRFVVTFGGFEEAEDISTLAGAYTSLTNSGILGLSNAAKLMKLPEDPDAPHIGRVFFSKDGPIFLDDMASDMVRNAALKAKMSGFELAANPQLHPQNQPPQERKPGEKQDGDQGNAPAQQGQEKAPGKEGEQAAQKPKEERAGIAPAHAAEDYRRWRARAIDDVKAGKPQRGFTTQLIKAEEHAVISASLARCETVDDVREVFRVAQDGKLLHWQDADKKIQSEIARLQGQGVKQLRWHSHVDACDLCQMNDTEVVNVGSRFISGALLPPEHGNCVCKIIELRGE